LGENPGNLFNVRSSNAQALRSFASAAAKTIYEAICQGQTADQLDQLARVLWRAFAEGAVSDDDAQFLQSCIDRTRPPARASTVGHLKLIGVGKLPARLGSRFTSRQRPRSSDRKASRDRRRRLGGSSALPDTLRHHYTEGQRAVLCIVAGEIKHHSVCDLPIDKMAALAGVCRTTVQTALHEARLLGHIKITERPMRGRKSLTNLVQITSAVWMTWIRRGPSAHHPIGSKFANLVSTTKNTDSRKKEAINEKEKEEGLAKRRRAEIGSWATLEAFAINGNAP
jgi:hypothetical protein